MAIQEISKRSDTRDSGIQSESWINVNVKEEKMEEKIGKNSIYVNVEPPSHNNCNRIHP